MEKEKKITAPDGCEIEKVELIDGVAVVTFREKELQLPKSWGEFCDKFSIGKDECYIADDSVIEERAYFNNLRYDDSDRNLLPDRATAEAVLALCQLIQLRNCYNGDWEPDWTEYTEEKKYFITMDEETISKESYYTSSVSPLYFKTKELRDEFLRYFRPLIEKLKPLYGIKSDSQQ